MNFTFLLPEVNQGTKNHENREVKVDQRSGSEVSCCQDRSWSSGAGLPGGQGAAPRQWHLLTSSRTRRSAHRPAARLPGSCCRCAWSLCGSGTGRCCCWRRSAAAAAHRSPRRCCSRRCGASSGPGRRLSSASAASPPQTSEPLEVTCRSWIRTRGRCHSPPC